MKYLYPEEYKLALGGWLGNRLEELYIEKLKKLSEDLPKDETPGESSRSQ